MSKGTAVFRMKWVVLVLSMRFPTHWANYPNSFARDWDQVALSGPAIRWKNS